MKIITAVIKSFKIDDLIETLTQIGVKGPAVPEMKGFGYQKGLTELYRGSDYQVDFLPKTKVEAVVDKDLVPNVVEVIKATYETGEIGDRKISASKFLEVLRIRRGDAISAVL